MTIFFQRTKVFLLAVWLFVPFLVQGQVIPSSSPASSEAEELQERVEELRRSGIPDNRIIEILQSELGVTELTLPPATAGIPSPSEQATPQAAPGLNNNQATPQAPAEIVTMDTVPDDNTPVAEPVEFDLTADKMGEYEPSGIFGHQIFRQSLSGDSISRLTPPPGYIVGPGDVFTITIYNRSELFESLTVTEEGAILRRQLGKIYVSGKKFETVKNILTQKYERLVAAGSIIEIGLVPNARTIGVNIVGEVAVPGYYQISASIPAFRAIIAAGGISDIGSVRNIQIKRNGRTVHTIDIYDYLLKGDYEPFYLQEEDFIFVPIQEKIVRIGGAVQRPMRYELRENENLTSLLEFSGGLLHTAMTQNVELRRLELVPSDNPSGPVSEKQNLIINLNLEQIAASPAGDYQLFDGDTIGIKQLKVETYNEISVKGRVAYPESYQLFQGEKVADVIRRAGGLTEDAYKDRAYIVRKDLKKRETEYIPIDLRNIFPDSTTVNLESLDNMTLQFKDVLIVFSESIFLEQRSLVASGRVKRPGTVQIYPTMNLRDLLYLIGGFEEDADLKSVELSLVTEAEDVDIDNFDPDPTQSVADTSGGAALVKRINIPENWQENASLDTILIYDFNRIRVYSRYDFIFTRNVSVRGAVKKGGSFPVKRGMTLTDVLYQAGGLTEPNANNVVELYKIIEVEEKGNFGTATDVAEIERIKLTGDWRENSLADSIDITSYYKVVVRSESEFVRQGMVRIKGMVAKPGKYNVLAGMTLKDIIYEAGGFQLEADLSQIELSRIIEVVGADGELVAVPTNIRLVSTIQNWQNDPSLDQIEIITFDQIFVRPSPDFQLQQSVYLAGEIVTPGEYNKQSRDERLSSVVARANGITELSHLEGAYIVRRNVGRVSIMMEKALRRPGSKYDLVLLEGDSIYIPPRTDAVTITGNVLVPGTTVMYERGNTRFKYYVNLAGGFARKSRKKETTVTYVDGRVKSVKRFFFFRYYPKIEQGCVINVPAKEPRGQNGEGRSWGVDVNNVIASATSILTFILLIDRTVGN